MPTDIEVLKGSYVEKNLGTIIQNFISEPKNPIETQVVYNVVGLGSKVYGRVEEAQILGDALNGRAEFASKRFFLIVAPSGFGKSYLLTKTLQDVTDGTIIKPDYEEIVRRIIRLDCRNTKSTTDIVKEFTNIIGLSFAYPSDFAFPSFEYFNGILFHYVRNVGTVWLVLDNFEAWLDGDNDYEPINGDIDDFLRALFEGNHTLRGVFLSQSPPVNFIRQKVKTLDDVGDSLYQGLPKENALLMLREGEGVDLSDVSEELLVEFLEKVAYIPQAINSLLGYMQDGVTLDEVLHAPEFERGFESYESDAERVEEGERRTNALIRRQIKLQSTDIKLLLQALAYFGKRLPVETLEPLFTDKLKARNAINRLKTHRLASEIKELSGTYYDLHAYFRRQTKIVLPDFSRIVDRDYALALLFEKGNQSYAEGFLQKAFDLYECAGRIIQELFDEGQTELERFIASSKMGQGIVLRTQGKIDEAIVIYDDVIKIYERLVNELSQAEVTESLALAYMNRGYTIEALGKFDEAIANYDYAIEIYEQSVDEPVEDESANYLALAYVNKAETLRSLGKCTEAIDELDKAIKIRERLVNDLGLEQFSNDLADVYLGKGNAFADLGKLDEAIVSYDETVKIDTRLVRKLGQKQFANHLAKAFWGKGVALWNSEKIDDAIANYEEAIKIFEGLVNDLGQDQFTNDLATVYMNVGIALYSQKNFEEAVERFDRSEKVREEYFRRRQFQVLPDFVRNIRNRVLALVGLKDWQRVSRDFITVFDLEGRWHDLELSDYFKQHIKQDQDGVMQALTTVTPKNREQVYKQAGKHGKEIKQLLKNFEKAEKN